MNQVQEMLRLKDAGKAIQAVERLSCLFNLMSRQPGFLRTEVFRNVDSPDTLLVLHAWETIEAWQTFQHSEEKVAFSASRPAALYDVIPCGMNWTGLHEEDDKGGRYLRREVIRPSTDQPSSLSSRRSSVPRRTTAVFKWNGPSARISSNVFLPRSAMNMSSTAPAELTWNS